MKLKITLSKRNTTSCGTHGLLHGIYLSYLVTLLFICKLEEDLL